MRFNSFAIAATSLLSASSVSAIPRPHVIEVNPSDIKPRNLQGRAFKISQVTNVHFHQHGKGPRALAQVYEKYGLEIPEDLLVILRKIMEDLGIDLPLVRTLAVDPAPGLANGTAPYPNSTAPPTQGEVTATPERFDVEYLAPVEIGTPPQTLMLNLDTGSSDLWVFSSETPVVQQGGQKLYDISKSTTAKKLGNHTWSIQYGDGSRSSGNVYLDTVSIGGVAVKEQAVESATSVSSAFTRDEASSGILGLGFDMLNQVVPNQQKTFISNALDTLAMPLFSANLRKAAPGNYNFGFIDSTEFIGNISFVDVDSSEGHWKFRATAFSTGNNGTNGPISDIIIPLGHTAIADTGTTLLMLPQAITNAYYAQVGAAESSPTRGGWVFPCNTTLPDLTLYIGTYKAVIPGELINFAPVDTDDFATATVCYGGVQSSSGFPFSIYGDVFFKAHWTVFHVGDKKLGFAPRSGL
ncbi:aspartic peptidase domain-containing protein [Podospora australis]|uniref:Aspartic peptidase domain-containing protein n=1 Tax=Podospora australis TaxID=1536484 RepID=A0AAN6X7N7_9PEZI|nr:aspartic peptidase domain-containing protein [Podospora australis]